MEQNEQERLRQEVDEVLHGSKQPQGPERFPQNDYSNVRHVIGVVSGKGGVGKSLVCGTLAVELARRGAKVGILDADVTGPSIPRMMGLAGARARGVDELIVPVLTKGGIRVMSANLVLENETDPVIWRAPWWRAPSSSSGRTAPGASSTTSSLTCPREPATCPSPCSSPCRWTAS